MKILITGLVATLLLAGSADLVAQDVAKPTPALMRASFGKLPIYFIENRGVFPDEVNYYIQGADKTLFFTKEGITFRLKGKEQAWVVKLEFVGANHDVEPRGECKQQAIFSYFKGPEKDWKTGLQTFSKIVYRDLWPGIDLIYRGTVNELKYEFVVKPGADPKKICLQYLGASEIKIAESGALEVETPLGSFEDASPEAWQVTKSGLEEVALSYLLTKDGTGSRKFGFEVGSYDPSKPLVLDPAILIYCGYVGGSHADECRAVAVDNAGNAFVAGLTSCDQNSFPVKVGPDLTFNNAYGSHDAFVAKVNASGSQLIYCGYIGGIEEDSCDGIAVDTRGNAYVVGRTESDEKTFPVRTGPFVVFDSPSAPDAFVAKVNASGTGLVYCGYIGGKDRDWGYGIDVDSAGSAYVVGVTLSDAGAEGFPVKNGPGKTYNGKTDAFVAKVRADGTSLDYCGYISGKSYDTARGVAVDASGNAYVIGTTESDETVPGGMFPVKVGPDLYFNGGNYSGDAFVAKVNPQGTGLVYCGYIGGDSGDTGVGIDVDSTGQACVTGLTGSTQSTFPVKVGPSLYYSGGGDVFVGKVDSMGTGLVYCGYVGGGETDKVGGIAVDGLGNAYVAGSTDSDQSTSPAFPAKVGPSVTIPSGGGYSAFAAKVNPTGTGFVYCGYVGGTDDDDGLGVAVDPAGNLYLVGRTMSNETSESFPVMVGPDLTFNDLRGYTDGFIAKVVLTLLEGSGTLRPGTSVPLTITASDDVGLSYVIGSSLGTGPIKIGARSLGLGPDNLLLVTVNNYLPTIFVGYRGVVGANGQATAKINIPNISQLVGLPIHSAFVTLSQSAPEGIKSISNTYSLTIVK